MVSRTEYMRFRQGVKVEQKEDEAGNDDASLVRALEEQHHRAAREPQHRKPPSESENPPMRFVLGFLSVADLLAAVSAETEGIPVRNAAEVMDAAKELWRTPVREAFGAQS